jgi:hypothetical protein
VAAAYLVQIPQAVPAEGLPLGGALEGFHAVEDGYRWSTDRASVRFRDPGAGVVFRVELDLSAWRPRGRPPAGVTFSAGGARQQASVSGRRQTFTAHVTPSGWWRSEVVATLDAETFRPGPSDLRQLGVRLHAARLVPLSGVVGWRRPPLGQGVAAACVTVFAFLALVGLGVAPRAAERVAGALPLVMVLAFAFARPWAVTATWPLALVAAAAATVVWTAPDVARALPALLADAGRSLLLGARVWRAGPAVGVVAGTALAVLLAHRAYPRLEVDLGSGSEGAVVHGFGASDGADGVTFRQALRGAEVDLRDFGGGSSWTIAVRSSTSGPARTAVLARAGSVVLAAPVDQAWTSRAFEARAPWGWRSGLSLSFPAASGGGQFRLDRIEVDRRGSWPSLRVLAAVVTASLLIGVAAGAVGVGAPVAYAAAALVGIGQAVALAAVPVGAIPFAGSFTAICLAGALLAAVLGAGARRRAGNERLPPAALLAAAVGFVAWLAAAAFPLYRGGHFVFHSQIAEEIWQGRFLLFYLPYPGSILSRQEQWGNVIVPHPCLYHTLMAPLSALPRPSFHAIEKALLALALASLLLLAARLAQRVEGDRASVWAAVVFATLAPTFQVLGLGHLMMLFGVWAASLALGHALLRFEDLPRPGPWLSAVLLFTVCFLSYTASLLFTAMVVAAAVALLDRRAPAPARALALAAIGAAALAFGLYYVNWAWPFVSESLPNIAASSAARGSGDTWSRVGLQPGKLTYTFGSALVPLLGLVGLLLTRGALQARVLLLCWASLLVVVGGMDLFFNFLRKHHYFVMVPVAVGGGVLLARMAERGRTGRLAAVGLALGGALLGLRTAIDVALGRIP